MYYIRHLPINGFEFHHAIDDQYPPYQNKHLQINKIIQSKHSTATEMKDKVYLVF